MDNETYLEHIAAQARPSAKGGKLLSPGVIKLIAGAVIALILIIVLGSVLNSANQKNITMYERFYLRVSNLSATSGPLAQYGKELKSSDLRMLSSTLLTSLTGTARDLSGVLSDLKVDTAAMSPEATNEEAGVLSSYTSALSDAKMNGLLDRTFATSTTLQISLLLSMESEISEKTDNAALATIVAKSTSDLQALLQQFEDYSNSN
ncbi:MAG: hypothetical protein ACK5MU_02475 [Candidatus Saccharimonadales bacterium]